MNPPSFLCQLRGQRHDRNFPPCFLMVFVVRRKMHCHGFPQAFTFSAARRAKVPALVTGCFRTLKEADRLIRAGDSDLVAVPADNDTRREYRGGLV